MSNSSEKRRDYRLGREAVRRLGKVQVSDDEI